MYLKKNIFLFKIRFLLLKSFLALVSIAVLLGSFSNVLADEAINWQNSSTPNVEVGKKPDQFYVSGDDAAAVLVMRQIFLEGGNAVDVLTAGALMAVINLPQFISPAAGGMCQALLPDRKSGGDSFASYQFVFSAGLANESMVSALYQLQGDYGVLPWQKLVAPAEKTLRLSEGTNVAEAGKLTALINSYTKLRLRPLAFIYGTGTGSMSEAYQNVGLNPNPPLVEGTGKKKKSNLPFLGLKTLESLRALNWQDKNWGEINFYADRNQSWNRQTIADLGRLVFSMVQQDEKTINLMKRKLPRSGVALMAVDSFGGAIACHFTLGQGASFSNDLGFAIPINPIKPAPLKSFFVKKDDSLLAILSIGQTAHGFLCRDGMTGNVFEQNCQNLSVDKRLGLSIKAGW